MRGQKLPADFFMQDVLIVAPALLGKQIVRVHDSGEISRHIISETEAYKGGDDLACHASKGKTPRTEVMFDEGGVLYIYLIYGMYWMLNVVTSVKDVPQAVLIRGLADVSGPGRLTKALGLDKSFNGENLCASDRIWIEDLGSQLTYTTHPRMNIDYAGEYWKNMPWRFVSGE